MSDLTRAGRCWNKLGDAARAIRFIRYNTMLSGAATHSGNAVSTGLNVSQGPFRTLTAAAVEPLARKAVGATGRQRFAAEAAAEAYGWTRAMPDFVKKVGRRSRKGGGDTSGQIGRGGREIDEIFANAPGGEGLKKVIGFPMRMMGAVDQWFFDRAFHGSVWRQAVRQSKKTGRGVQEIMNEQSQLMRKIEGLESKIDDFRAMRREKIPLSNSQTAEMRRLMKEADALYEKSFAREASLNAEKVIFTSREGEGLDQAMSFLDGMSKRIPLIDAIFPFRRTPANIVREILRGSPIGAIGGAIRARKALNAGQLPREAIAGRLADDLGQAIAGTAAMYAIFELVDRGFIKANPFKERERAERVTEEAAGILPDTIQIGDYSFPVRRLEPLGSHFLAAARAAESFKAGEDPDPNTLLQIAEMTKNLATTAVGDTFFDPFADFSEALQDDKSWERWAERFGGSFVPRAVTQFDQRIREEEGPIAGPLKQLPGAGEAKLGLFGEERGAQAPLVSLVAGRTGKADDPIAQEMVRVGAFHLPPTGLTKQFQEQLSRRGIEYSDAEDRVMKQAKGRVQRLLTERTINSPAYQNLPDTAEGNALRARMIERAFKQASNTVNSRAKALKLAKVPLSQQALFQR